MKLFRWGRVALLTHLLAKIRGKTIVESDEGHDARVRGRIAQGVALIFFGAPTLAFLIGVPLGTLSLDDIESFLKPWALYFGPLTGAVFGYYFGASRVNYGKCSSQSTDTDS